MKLTLNGPLFNEVFQIICTNESKANSLRQSLLKNNNFDNNDELNMKIIKCLGEFEYDFKTLYRIIRDLKLSYNGIHNNSLNSNNKKEELKNENDNKIRNKFDNSNKYKEDFDDFKNKLKGKNKTYYMTSSQVNHNNNNRCKNIKEYYVNSYHRPENARKFQRSMSCKSYIGNWNTNNDKNNFKSINEIKIPNDLLSYNNSNYINDKFLYSNFSDKDKDLKLNFDYDSYLTDYSLNKTTKKDPNSSNNIISNSNMPKESLNLSDLKNENNYDPSSKYINNNGNEKHLNQSENNNFLNENINNNNIFTFAEPKQSQNLDKDFIVTFEPKNINEYQKNKYYEAPIKETDKGLIVLLPDNLFSIKERNITKELSTYIPRKFIDRVIISDNIIKVYGHIYLRRFNLAKKEDQIVKAFLFNEDENISIELESETCTTHFLTEKFGVVLDKESGNRTNYNYDGAGFVITINPKLLIEEITKYGKYKLKIYYKNRFFSGTVILSGIDGNLKGKINHQNIFFDKLNVRVGFNQSNEIIFDIKEALIFLKQMKFEGDLIVCRLNKPVEIMRAYISKEDNVIFNKLNESVFFIDTSKLKKDFNSIYVLQAKRNEWINVIDNNKRVEVKCGNKNVLIYSCLRTGVSRIHIMKHGTFIKSSEKKGSRLYIETFTCGDDVEFQKINKAQIYVPNRILKENTILSESDCMNNGGNIICKFEIDFSNEEIIKNFYAGTRWFNIIYIDQNNRKKYEYSIYCSVDFSHNFIINQTLSILCYRSMFANIRMQIQQKWAKKEDSKEKRDILIKENYHNYRQEKIEKKRILFESMWGSKYSCNPRALYEYIDKNYPEYECIWSFNEERTPINGKGNRVRKGSLKYYYYLATSKYLVNNVNFPDDYIKRPEQIEIQTMHGTPLKTLGLDAPSEFPTVSSKKNFIKRNSRWDYLLVQGNFMKDKAYDCFNFKKEIIKSGYPRTDILFKRDKSYVLSIRESLRLPKNKKIILYAPTWRKRNKFDMRLDLDLMKEKLKKDYIILIRLHHFCSNGYKVPADNKFIFNLTDYQSVEDLFLISDILITDYSSVMFDYALLNKPMLFFTYDFEEYRDNLRGLYVDFEKEAPGPLLFNSEDIVDAILNIENIYNQFRNKIDKFYSKYLCYEKNNSCEEIFKIVFEQNFFRKLFNKFKN